MTAIITLLFADVLFLGTNFYVRDLFAYHFPMKSVVRQILLRGEFPWWNPYFASGQPMAANPAYEIFYPPQWLILAGPYRFGFALHILFHVYLAAIGAFAFFRSIPLRRDASVFGALSFSLSGFLLGTATNLPTFFVWSWAGAVAWATLRVVRGGSVVPASFIVAMPMLVGEPISMVQIVVLMLLFGRSAVRRVAAVVVIALLLASVQLVPAAGHARDSIRSRGFPFETVVDYSMPPARAIELIAPLKARPEAHTPQRTHYFLSIYCGAAVLALFVAGVVTRQRGSGYVIAIAAVSAVFAIGDRTPLWRVLYAAGIHGIRYPEKWIAAGIVSIIAFATLVANRMLEGDDRIRRIAVLAAGGLAIAGLIAPAWALIFVAWALMLWLLEPARAWYAAAAVLMIIELGVVSLRVTPRRPAGYFTPPDVTRAFRSDRDAYAIFHRGEWTRAGLAARADTREAMRPYSPAAWGFRTALEADVDETALLPTHDLLDAMKRLAGSNAPGWSDRVANASNVRYILDYAPGGGLSVQEIPNRGRFAMAMGRVIGVEESASSAAIDVETPAPAPLVITITRHEYWRATIDGEPAALTPANLAYMKVDVPAGRHRVTLRYRNPLVYFGALVTVLTTLALLMKSRSGKLRSR
jgi:hypothetical protein